MELCDFTFEGPPIDDREVFDRLPQPLRRLLEDTNGFVRYGGGLHVRGACTGPEWHSLRRAWSGEAAFHRLYDGIEETDIPFAQDCLGDQFLLRDDKVLRLSYPPKHLAYSDAKFPVGGGLKPR